MQQPHPDPQSATGGPARTAAIVAVYTLVFWVLLPLALWAVAVGIDRAMPVALEPTPLGAIPAAWGLWLLASGMVALWRRGQGWPVSALPPPRLVTGGPYRIVRHPIYLGFNLAALGVGAMVGSVGLAGVVAPLFLPVWLAYATIEEGGLVRRFGVDYRRYRRQVPLLPRPSLRWLLGVLNAVGILRVRIVQGAERVPAQGPVVLVGNHTCYADPVWMALVTRRRVWMAATAEAYRSGGWIGALVRLWPAFPVRRYRTDPVAARWIVDLLRAGEVVGLFNERERSVLGAYLGTEPAVAAILPRLGVPVIPVAIGNAYASGPRWSGSMRFPTIEIRVGRPLDWSVGPAHEVLDDALRGLLDTDPQRVWLEAEPLDRLFRAVWRCPGCLDEAGWRPAALACGACGRRWGPSGDGRVVGPDGEVISFADWARPVWRAPEALPLEVPVEVWREDSVFGPIRPLRSMGPATLSLDVDGLRFGDVHLSPDRIRTTSTERADTLQIGTSDAMWQFRTAAGSPFRLRNAVDAVRASSVQARSRAAPIPAPAAPAPPRPIRVPTVGAAIGLGIAVSEGLFMLLPLSVGHRAAGLAEVIPMALAYVVVGGIFEGIGRAVGMGSAAIGAAILAIAAAGGAASQLPLAALALMGGAGLWAWAAHRPPWRGSALAVALWGLSPVLPRPTPAPPPIGAAGAAGPSFVVVVLDTVRADRTSLERADRDTTPHLAALADRGIRFSRAYSTSCWTLPAHASILTGLMPSRHGAHYEHLHLDDAVPVITEQLRVAGYDTAAFSANPLVTPGTGLGRGFVRFDEPWRRTTVREVMIGWRVWHRFAAPSRDKAGAAVARGLAGWHAARDPDRPFFVLVNLLEAHAPYQEVPHGVRSRFVEGHPSDLEAEGERLHLAQVFGGDPDVDPTRADDLMDGAVAAADAYLGRLRRILGDDPVWIVVSDHGELLGEHEGLWGHNAGLYEALIRVPMVIAVPGMAAGRIDAPVSLVDIAPTVRSLAGLSPLPSDGRDLTPILAGGLADAARVVEAEHFRTDYLTEGMQLARPRADQAALRARRGAAISQHAKRQRSEAGLDVGFDLASDPKEERPLPGAATGLAVELRAPTTPRGLDPDAQQRAALKALGYTP